ncbi:hypothetical protein Dpep_1165 [Dethiosulfovibrio peptidovorans DSM 11002]|uniref:Uncharacterized protein n=1 Tax=Dethiosulfovibrio peptidovorans DSM 11002 TaxID=469381 RepID=D2Z6U4_9BACT|nr:hypothetical protein [Dethiosulfovibrio peptidovorans]EFC91191.1 hypothetical protein Dpep_1165 [Dethiosulfovibrio peptidovorans DSM 11002]
MADSRGYGIYRILKGRIDVGHGGESGRIFFYALYGKGKVKICHAKEVSNDGEEPPKGGIKAGWKDFSAFVDGGCPDPSLSSGIGALFQDSGVDDVKEENLAKLRYIEKMFGTWAAQIRGEECAAFVKVEGMTTSEADELLSRFPEEEEDEDQGDNAPEAAASLGDTPIQRKLPKLIFTCFTRLDPVNGVAASDVSPGDLVTITIPEDSPLFGTMKGQNESFDGSLSVPLSSVEESDSDRLLLEFELGDGVMAVAMTQKSLRIKAVRVEEEKSLFAVGSPAFIALVGGCCAALLALIAYILS